jgi:hypothetical protein
MSCRRRRLVRTSDLLSQDCNAPGGSARLDPSIYESVLLFQDILPTVLETLFLSCGLRIKLLMQTCRMWRDIITVQCTTWIDALGTLQLQSQNLGQQMDPIYGSDGLFYTPCDVVALTDGSVCVADPQRCQVQLLSASFVSTFETAGREEAAFDRNADEVRAIGRIGYNVGEPVGGWLPGVHEPRPRVITPTGLAFEDGDGGSCLYVSDSTQSCVQRWDVVSGEHLAQTELGDLAAPQGLCVVENISTLFVCDSASNCIFALGLDAGLGMPMPLLYSFGEKGTNPGQFRSPQSVAAHRDKLFVTDGNNHRIQVFGLDLENTWCLPKFSCCFGGEGDLPGLFYHPEGVAVVNERMLLVSERLGERVQSLTLDGGPLQVIDMGSPLGGLSASLEVGGVVRVYVTAMEESLVHVFTLRTGQPEGTSGDA